MVKTIPPFFYRYVGDSVQFHSHIHLFAAPQRGIDGCCVSRFSGGTFKIFSPKEVELADETPSKTTAENYADYPLVVLNREKQTEVAHVTADEHGNYSIALAPGDYVLDVQNRRRRHLRASPQPFTVLANQTVHVDMAIDTGVR